MKWGLVIASRAKRQLRHLSASDREQIDEAFLQMRADPFDGDVKYLRGEDGFRHRVGDWRILFELDESKKIIIVSAVKRRASNTY